MKSNLTTEKAKNYLATLPDYPVLKDKEQRELLHKWLTYKDKDAYDKLIYANKKIVLKQAYKFSNQHTDIEDLIQCGMIGLIKAINHFDQRPDVKFISYAVYWINAELISYAKKETKHKFKVKKGKDGTEYIEFGRTDNVSNLLEHSDNSEKRILEKDNARKAKDLIRNTYDCLSDKEQYVIEKYYFDNEGFKNCSCEKLSKTLNVSKQRVAMIMAKATSKIAKKIKRNKNLKDFLA